jgi:hypothetical protein
MAAKLRVGSIPAARSRPRERPLSARLARCPRYHEDPLTEPTAGAQPCRRERVLVPTIRTLLWPIRYRRVERAFGIGLLRPREAARRARLPTSHAPSSVTSRWRVAISAPASGASLSSAMSGGQHARPLGNKSKCRGAADPLRRRGHQGAFTCEPSRHRAKLPRAAPHSKLTKLAVRESGPAPSVNCGGAHPPIPKLPEGNDP